MYLQTIKQQNHNSSAIKIEFNLLKWEILSIADIDLSEWLV